MRYRREQKAAAPKAKPLHKEKPIDELGARTLRSVASAYGYSHQSEVNVCLGDWLSLVRREFVGLAVPEEQRTAALSRLAEKIDEIVDLLAGRAVIEALTAQQLRLAQQDCIARINALFDAAAAPRTKRPKTEDEDELHP